MLKRFRYLHILLSAFSILSVPLFAETQDPQSEKPKKEYYDLGAVGDFEIMQGYRQDDLKWSVSKHKKKRKNPFEQSYRKVYIYETRAASKFTMNDNVIKIGLGYGNVRTGHVHNADFQKKKKSATDVGKAKVRGSYAIDAKLSYGRNFALGSQVVARPLVGYLWEIEKLRSKHGHLVRENDHKVHKRIHHLNSTYKSRWNAPFIGLDAVYKPLKELQLYGEYNFLFAVKNHASGFWNWGRGRHHGLHFEQHSKRSKGFGHIGLGGIGYEWVQNLWLKVEYQFSWLEAKGGKMRGKEHHDRFSTPFHKARLMSQEVRLSLEYDL